jgi:lipoprotein-anchoring transpeptidase ErfK/SrfK
VSTAARRGGRGSVAALALLLAAAAPAAAQEDFALTRPGDDLWRWALVERGVDARSAPHGEAAVVARVRRRTPERTPEALALLARREVDGRLWLRVRLPVLPNGTTGWVPRSAVGPYEESRTHLIVDRGRLRARLERRGRTVFRARIGIGRPGTPTPAGQFIVRNRLTGFRDPVYGALAFGTTARSATLTDWPGGGFVGIHGTNQPELLPGRVSHGCIRLRDRDIRRLDRRMPVGTAVTIR